MMMQSGQRNKSSKKRDYESPISETASEKAVKDAMLKTRQMIYFPKAFQTATSKQGKKEVKHLAEEHQPASNKSAVKRAVVNLESDNEAIELQSPQMLICPTMTSGIVYGDQNLFDEHSFASIEGLIEGQTELSANLSKMSGGGRRSRKDRSGAKYNSRGTRNSITPTVLMQLKSQRELDVSPSVRMMPGSDAISLELNIKGMTEPNKEHETEEPSDEITQESSQHQPRKGRNQRKLQAAQT